MEPDGIKCSSSPAPPFSLMRFSDQNQFMEKSVVSLDQGLSLNKRESQAVNRPKPASSSGNVSNDSSGHHIMIPEDGVYLIVLKIRSPVQDKLFDASVDIEIKNTYGYLSAIEYPLLHFYGIMCAFYGMSAKYLLNLSIEVAVFSTSSSYLVHRVCSSMA